MKIRTSNHVGIRYSGYILLIGIILVQFSEFPSFVDAGEIYFEKNLLQGKILNVATGMTLDETRSFYGIELAEKDRRKNSYRITDSMELMPEYCYVIEVKKGEKMVIRKEDIDRYHERHGTKRPFKDRFIIDVSDGDRKEVFRIKAHFRCNCGSDISAKIFDWYSDFYGRPADKNIKRSGVFQRWRWEKEYKEIELSRRDDQDYYHLSVYDDLIVKYRNSGLEREKQKDLDGAIKFYSRAIDLNLPSYKRKLYIAYIRRGVCRKLVGDSEKAESDYSKALDLWSNNPRVHNDLAWILATHPDGRVRDGKYAVELAEKMMSMLKKPVPPAIDTLAAAYAEAGRFEDAIATQKKAVTLLKEMGKGDSIPDYTKRLESYQSNTPWREE